MTGRGRGTVTRTVTAAAHCRPRVRPRVTVSGVRLRTQAGTVIGIRVRLDRDSHWHDSESLVRADMVTVLGHSACHGSEFDCHAVTVRASS